MKHMKDPKIVEIGLSICADPSAVSVAKREIYKAIQYRKLALLAAARLKKSSRLTHFLDPMGPVHTTTAEYMTKHTF